MQLIIFGPPGAGKDTLSKMLETDYGLYHFSMGNELRSAREQNDDIGNELKKIMGKGDLVPDPYTYNIVKSRLEGREDYLLNGFPRNIRQCLWLESEIKAKINAFIDLQVNESVLMSRLVGPDGRGRGDDTEEIIAHRLQVFEEQTQPVWQYLRARTNHIKVDGNGSVEEVYSAIRNGLESLTS